MINDKNFACSKSLFILFLIVLSLLLEAGAACKCSSSEGKSCGEDLRYDIRARIDEMSELEK